MWAWGKSRVLDYLIAERTELNTKQVTLIGHSRLGKTALWCAAQLECLYSIFESEIQESERKTMLQAVVLIF